MEERTMEAYVSAAQVAGYLNITRPQVLEMTRRGLIPGHPIGTGSSRRVWRYKLTEVDAEIIRSEELRRKGVAVGQNAIGQHNGRGSPLKARKGKYDGQGKQ